MVNFLLNDQPVTAPEGATYLDVLGRQMGEDAADVQYDPGTRPIAMLVGGEVRGLHAHPKDGECARSLTYRQSEGRRVYERSVRFVLLLAVRQLYPAARVRIEHSAGHGVFITLGGVGALTHGMVAAIEARMGEIVAQDIPFKRKRVTRDEAMAYFAGDGQYDTVRLLKYRRFDYFHLYQLGGMMEYFYGDMAPSTGYVPVFALRLSLPGLIISLPDPANPRRLESAPDRPMLMRTFAESNRWASILECDNTADLNEIAQQHGMREFIRVNEALHEKSIADIADKFVLSGARLILIAGPSSSGKTTFAKRLSIQLRVNGLRPVSISLDDYYIDRDLIPYDEHGRQDLERLDTLDVKLFNDHLVRLMQGEEVALPLFDFQTGKRSEKTRPMHVKEGQPIVVEGIHGLNDELTADVPHDMKFKIYISALTVLNLDDHNRIRTTDVRLLRRLVRDSQFRGASMDYTMNMWDSVRHGEENYIFPFQENADVMFNSSLVYELAILKKYAYPMLCSVEKTSANYPLARRMVKFLNYFLVSEAEDEVPPNSILREFIGNSCFAKDE